MWKVRVALARVSTTNPLSAKTAIEKVRKYKNHYFNSKSDNKYNRWWWHSIRMDWLNLKMIFLLKSLILIERVHLFSNIIKTGLNKVRIKYKRFSDLAFSKIKIKQFLLHELFQKKRKKSRHPLRKCRCQKCNSSILLQRHNLNRCLIRML